jgi:hypothetical protein
MLTILPETKGNLLAVQISEKFTSEDFGQYKIMIRDRMFKFGTAKVYFEMSEFRGWKFLSFVENAIFDIVHGRKYGKVVMVGEKSWQHLAAIVASPVKKKGVKYFSMVNRELAIDYVND